MLVVNREELEEIVRGALADAVIGDFCGRFNDVECSPEEVGKMHKRTRETVISYIKDGRIKATQGKKYGEYKIRLGDALQLDFTKMRAGLRVKS
jgi:hypothetical protein